ncbi:MAG: hypothetical protein CML06_12545 [Pseudomonadales bacterium]|nr:hypothetical protein [Pseudomonadales bacterium]
MTLAGTFAFQHRFDPAGGSRLTISGGQRPEVARLLAGRSLSEASRLIPLLFNLCRRAQGVACARGAEQSQGLTVDSATAHRRQWLLQLEWLQEHLWLLWVRLPQWLQLSPRAVAMSRASQLLQRCMQALEQGEAGEQSRLWDWAGTVYSEDFAHSMAGATALQPLLEAVADLDWRSAYRPLPLPKTDTAWWRDCNEFRAGLPPAPQGPAHGNETGALVRQQHGVSVAESLRSGWCLIPRLLAVVEEVRTLLSALAQGRIAEQLVAAEPGNPSPSRLVLGQAETARGRLVHGMVLGEESQQVQQYRVIAPTDWNFQPQGALPAMAADLPAADCGLTRQRLGALVVLMNPCVGWELVCDA